MTKSKRSREELLAIGLGAVAVILMAFLMYNQLTALKTGYADIAEERASLNQARVFYRELKQLESQAAEMRRHLAGLQNALPGDPGEDLLINDISNTATATGSELLQVQFAERVTQKKYVEMPLTIALAANYQGMLDFLDHLQNGSRAMRIEEFAISGGDQTSPFINADITITAFYTD
ncbi:type 4a pilus biogenesis protein PilO [Desulfoscipio sp. XC116]|uniref:type 4a pilus biogenesis protein PilO n=1 Tax=Desulfoscipio sp. XC116 TaxID=3144975 RepID=UPI00325B2862